jgi:hypothetical protein
MGGIVDIAMPMRSAGSGSRSRQGDIAVCDELTALRGARWQDDLHERSGKPIDQSPSVVTDKAAIALG